ncbi:MAG: EAL domain-containing protein [Gammaproteobacteria bacterium]|nr:MAG: EAL domain-containing protein [Gammaproteobacteria bacterium]
MTAESFKALVIGGSDAEASALGDAFREAGHNASITHIERDEEIGLALKEGPFAIAIALPLAGELPLDKIGEGLGSLPWIACMPANSDNTIIEALEAGAIATADPARPREVLLKALAHVRRGGAPSGTTAAASGTEEEGTAFFADGMILQANDAFARLLGYESPDDLDCQPVIDLIAEQDQDKFKAFLKSLGAKPSEIGINLCTQDDSDVLVAMTIANATLDGEVCKQISIQIGESGSAGGGLSMNDPVTGLINRQFFLDHLGAALVQAANVTTIDHVLLICVDLFDQLTTRFGFTGADGVMADLAKLAKTKADKRHYLSRFGDNMLAMMMPHTDADTAEAFANELCKMVNEHMCEVSGQTLQYTVSIGIAVLNAKSPRDPVELLDQCRQAVEELRSKKPDGAGNGANVFSRTTKKATAAATGKVLEEEPDLAEALDQGNMRLLFQPLLSIKGDVGDHYEAYVRMLNPDGEVIPPAKFMDQLDAKLASKLDRWVILEGIKHLSEQRAKGNDTRLAINLTAFAMADDSLTPWLKVAMQAGDIPPNAMVFQIAEEDFARNINQGKTFAERIKGIGCCLGITHFGGGANDPSTTLKHLAVDYVKLSPKFSMAIQDGSGDPQPLKDIITVVNNAKRKVVVPNVENASMLAILWQASANFIQGNYLQAPQPEMNYEFSEIA